ncbi:MAG: hypothetical protein ACRCW0_05570 [Clostridium sp.]
MNYEGYELVPLRDINNIKLSEEMEEFMALYSMRGLISMQRNDFMGFLTPMPAIVENDDFITYDFIEESEEHKKNECNDNYKALEKIANRIERNNPEIFDFLESTGTTYLGGRNLIKKIIRLSMMYR